jgi:hypothetical protein
MPALVEQVDGYAQCHLFYLALREGCAMADQIELPFFDELDRTNADQDLLGLPLNRWHSDDEAIAYPVFGDIDAVELNGRDAESRARIKSILNVLSRTGPMRPIAQPDRSVADQLETLSEDFPNFAQVVDFVRPYLLLLNRWVVRPMPPLLLVGPPGVGKTYFAQAMAEVLNAAYQYIDLAAETNGSIIAGSSTFWSNSAPGAVLTTLLRGTGGRPAVANPVIFVDEIDKCGRDLRYDPLAPLYSLLEPRSARHFQDQSMPGLEIDTSQIRWVFAANDASSIPEPIMSRLVRFDIRKPSADQQRGVIQSIAANLCGGLLVPFDSKLPSVSIEDCLPLSPREARLRIDHSIAMALAAGLHRVTPEIWRRSRAVIASENSHRQRVGFV